MKIGNNRGKISKILLEDPEEYEALRQGDDPETLLEFTNQYDPGLVINFGIKNLVEWIYSSEIVDHISKKMSWLVLDLSNQGFSLLTSDQPCVFTSVLSHPDCFVFLPLSPTHLFVACNAGITVRDKRRLVKDSNKLVVEQAFSYVYSGDNSQERFVKNHLNLK